MKTKSLFASKTAAFGFITAVAGAIQFFVPEAKDFVVKHSEVILLGVGILSVALRAITKDKVVLFPE